MASHPLRRFVPQPQLAFRCRGESLVSFAATVGRRSGGTVRRSEGRPRRLDRGLSVPRGTLGERRSYYKRRPTKAEAASCAKAGFAADTIALSGRKGDPTDYSSFSFSSSIQPSM